MIYTVSSAPVRQQSRILLARERRLARKQQFPIEFLSTTVAACSHLVVAFYWLSFGRTRKLAIHSALVWLGMRARSHKIFCVAIRAPSVNDFSFAHLIHRWTCCAKGSARSHNRCRP